MRITTKDIVKLNLTKDELLLVNVDNKKVTYEDAMKFVELLNREGIKAILVGFEYELMIAKQEDLPGNNIKNEIHDNTSNLEKL